MSTSSELLDPRTSLENATRNALKIGSQTEADLGCRGHMAQTEREQLVGQSVDSGGIGRRFGARETARPERFENRSVLPGADLQRCHRSRQRPEGHAAGSSLRRGQCWAWLSGTRRTIQCEPIRSVAANPHLVLVQRSGTRRPMQHALSLPLTHTAAAFVAQRVLRQQLTESVGSGVRGRMADLCITHTYAPLAAPSRSSLRRPPRFRCRNPMTGNPSAGIGRNPSVTSVTEASSKSGQHHKPCQHPAKSSAREIRHHK
eukprot:2739402-Rhodomonas_salina.2